jgi:hypothetical protein
MSGKTGKKAATNPGKGTAGRKTTKQPKPGGVPGTTTVVQRHVNQAAGAAGANQQLSESEKQKRLDNVRAAQAKRDAEFNSSSARARFILGRRNDVKSGCKTTISVYVFSKAKVPTRPGAAGGFICGLDEYLRYREEKYNNQENEFRVFIEGAEVSPYVEGSLSWTVESTGGMNTARFILNNNEDIFIITPSNVCAGPYNRAGWRVQGSGAGKATKVYESVFRKNFRVDEAAKWRIYRTKYEIVAPESEDAQIDAFTGMWLYPLNPYSCIFNRNDAVRIFIRLPHVGVTKRRGYRETPSLWMPAFTGFIKDYSWNDDPVQGKRIVNLTCYDYRGLMDRMRVRINPPPDKGKGTKPKQKNKSGGTQKDAGSSKPKDNKDANEPSHNKGAYLKEAEKLGRRFQRKFSRTYNRYARIVKELGQPTLENPFQFANAYYLMKATLDDLYALMLAKRMLLGGGTGKPTQKGCQGTKGSPVDLGRGQFLKPGSGFNVACAQAAVADIDSILKTRAVTITRATAKLINDMALLYDLKGQILQVVPKTYKSRGGDVAILLEVRDGVAQSTKKLPAKAQRALKNGKKNSVVAVLTDVAKLIETRKPTIIKALQDMVLYWVAVRGGSWSLRIKTAGAYASAVKALKSVDASIDHELTRNRLLDEADRKTIVISDAQSNQLRMIIESTRKQLTALRASSVKLEQEYQEAGKPGSKGRKQEMILKDQTAVRNAITVTSNLLKSMERKRARSGIGKGKGVYVRLKFKYPSVAAFEEQISTGLATNVLQQLVSRGDPALAVDQLKTKFIPDAVLKLVDDFRAGLAVAVQEANDWGTRVRNDATVQVGAINVVLAAVEKERKELEKILRDKRYGNLIKTGGVQKIKEVRTVIRSTTAAGRQAGARIKTLAEVKTKFANFEVKQAGIFADLTTTVKDQPHPLMGKSFEQAVEYLCCEQTRIARGVIMNISSYGQKPDRSGNTSAQSNNPAAIPSGQTILDQFNRIVLFGVVGRPLTFQEVSAVGRHTVSDLGEDFSPHNVFYHMLRPASGTSPATIIQQQTGQTGMNSPSVNYETRRKLLDDVCSVLDYQFFVSGWGDLIFELPNYNAFPGDYGLVFRDAYTLLKGWKTATIAEEAQEIPTAWVITGLEPEASIQKGTKKPVAKNEFRKIVIMAPILARRLGVRVQNVNLRIPGIGAPAGVAGNSKLRSSPTQALDQLEVYGFFYIQRQLGRAHTVSATLPFRPYIMPNRPIWLVHRQRIGLVQNVTHSMTPPNGECTTEVALSYTRWLHRDGTFRFMSGGNRQPIDYTSFFTGIPSYRPTEGVRKSGSQTGKSIGRAGTGPGCRALNERAAQASAFASTVAGSFGVEFRIPPDPTGGRVSGSKNSAINKTTSGLRSETPSKRTGGNKSPSTGNPPSTNKTPKNRSGSSSSAPAEGAFHSAWAYLNARDKRYQSYYVRKASEVYYYKGGRSIDSTHSGWDIIAPVGTKMWAPVDILYMYANMGVGPLTGATKYGYVKAASLKKGLFKTGRTVGEFVQIYADQYILWRAMSKKYGKDLPIFRERGGGGLYIGSWGYYSNAKVSKGKALVKFLHVHCADLASTVVNGERRAYGCGIYGNIKSKTPILKKGDVIGYVGTTGTREPHLHLSMAVAKSESVEGTDTTLVSAMLAENKRFIDGVNMARAVNWRFDGTDPTKSIPPNRYARNHWRYRVPRSRAFRHLRRKKGRPQVTAADVVKWYQQRNSYKKYFKEKTVNFKALRGIRLVSVNPALFFLPGELVDAQNIGKSRKKAVGLQSRRERYGAYSRAAYQTSSTAYSRTMRGQDECRMLKTEMTKKAKTEIRHCDIAFSPGLANPYTRAWAQGQLKKCKKKWQTMLRQMRGRYVYAKWFRRRINQRLDSIARRELTAANLRASVGQNKLGIAYFKFRRNR